MMGAIVDTFKDLLTTKGRIPRSTFWWYHGLLFALLFFIGMLQEFKAVPESAVTVLSLFILPLLIIRIMVEIKRWHDLDRSGWWVLIGLIPCVGFIWVLVACGFQPGTKGENRFGPDPLQF